MKMPPMLAYTVQSTPWQNNAPSVTIDVGANKTGMWPANNQDDSYWFCIIDGKNPRVKVKDWVLPGSSNSTVPAGIDTYMNDPDYLFAVATQYLNTLHVPQGPLYDFLVNTAPAGSCRRSSRSMRSSVAAATAASAMS